MKKNIAKPKFYTLDKESVKEPTTGYIFFKHYQILNKEKDINKDKKIMAITKLYCSKETEKFNNQYIELQKDRKKWILIVLFNT